MSELLSRFEAGQLAEADFDHAAHLSVAIALLRTTGFVDAVARYMNGISLLAAENPEKVNVTITVAFLSAIAERQALSSRVTESEFLAAYPELSSRMFLSQWYDNERLASEAARELFLMPEPCTCRHIAHS